MFLITWVKRRFRRYCSSLAPGQGAIRLMIYSYSNYNPKLMSVVLTSSAVFFFFCTSWMKALLILKVHSKLHV